MSASTVCTTVNTGEKPDESGDASVMAGSDVQTHSRGLCDTETEGDGVDEVVVMCVVWGGWKIGLSFYSVDTGFLHTMSDVAEAEDFGLTKRVLAQVEPKVVVVSSKVDERLLRILRAYATPGEEEDGSRGGIKIEILPSSDFKLETCKHRLFATNLPGVPTNATAEQRHILVSSLLPTESLNMVRSIGALLKYVEKKRLGVELEDTSIPVPILALRNFSLDQLVVVDENSYIALQIFQKETHPSVYKGGGGSKEGLSLFGIMNRTKSPLGSRTLRLWFQRPLRDIPTLQQRLDAVSFLAAPKNTEVTTNIQDCLKHIRNLPRILARMETAQCSICDWQALYKTIYNAIFIGDMCRALPHDISIFKRIAAAFTDELPRVASLINQIIDFGESSLHNRFVVKPNIDSELDEKKQLYNGLPDLMTQVAEEELAKLPDYITQCTIIYVPQLGFLLSIPRAPDMLEEKDFVLPGLEFVFLSNNTVHYKTDRTKELDAQLGDTQCEITDRETIIMHRLQAVILEHTNILLDTVELAAELDCLLALAVFAREHNCVRPELQEEPGIYIKAGRHPLQELCVTAFVPNDAHIDLKHGRMKVLTGPNASGKSVYLKQVGLLVFMAHLGSFVPADAALIGMVDHIFTRIRTRETVSVALSTFMIDLNQVAAALRESTEKSLVLLDEYGKGTATVDGLALLTASLRHWLAKGSMCPSVLVSTHFHGLVKQKLLPDTECVEYLTMDTLRDGDELVFLYQLVPGLSDISYACHIAAGVGLPAHIVQRAAEVSELIRANKLVGKIGGPGLKRQKEVCEAVVSKFLELDLDSDNIVSFLKDFVIPTTGEK